MRGRSRTNKVLRSGTVLIGALLFTGCSYWPSSGNNGLLYTNVTKPVAVLSSEATTVRTGEACAIGLFGLFAAGDSSVSTARDNVGITNITLVEENYKQILLGAYSRYCVIVSGT